MAGKSRLIVWQVKREVVEVSNGQQHWDRAYQKLLQWSTQSPTSSASQPAEFNQKSLDRTVELKVGTKDESSFLC